MSCDLNAAQWRFLPSETHSAPEGKITLCGNSSVTFTPMTRITDILISYLIKSSCARDKTTSTNKHRTSRGPRLFIRFLYFQAHWPFQKVFSRWSRDDDQWYSRIIQRWRWWWWGRWWWITAERLVYCENEKKYNIFLQQHFTNEYSETISFLLPPWIKI